MIMKPSTAESKICLMTLERSTAVFCKADACMAWRWVFSAVFSQTGKQTHGYCGLASMPLSVEDET